MMVLAGVAAALLLLASAGLAAAQAAASQISASRLRTLQSEGFSGAGELAEARERDTEVRAGVRLVTRILNLSALGIVAAMGASVWGRTGPVLVLVGAGILVITVVADLLPHVLAARSPVRLALGGARILLAVARTMRPLTAPVEQLQDRHANGNGPAEKREDRELREIQEIQAIGEEEGVLEESEGRLVERAYRLDELTAWDVMVPRVDIVAWPENLTLEDVVRQLPQVPYSRVPVYRGSIDEITGIVYVREAYERYVEGDGKIRLSELARAPFFVPGSLPLTQLLQDFQSRRIHMGIVADEFGGTDGLVTLEDVLEELVGEIHDEMDVAEEDIVHVGPNAIECDAGIDVRDLNEALGVELPKAEHRSLNGFILEELGYVPSTGESFERSGVLIEILEATETHVVRARLTRAAEATEAAG
ncbi:MAG TPA: hemolysin family protein [Longimicrobiales bacterium]|nr:hemolysin family protein [Longimicrobiales bacterium]